MKARKYLPTLPELIDRLTIVQLKAIYISEHKTEYNAEIKLILHDIDLILAGKDYALTAKDIHAVAVLAVANKTIWENESIARAGGKEAEGRLRLTHSINGCRNTAKNVLAKTIGDRLDAKVDCLAADLPEEYGNWAIFG